MKMFFLQYHMPVCYLKFWSLVFVCYLKFVIWNFDYLKVDFDLTVSAGLIALTLIAMRITLRLFVL